VAVRALIRDRRNSRSSQNNEDFVSDLIIDTDDDPEMTEADVIQSCITLLMGGYETTTSLIANTVLLLLQRPELLAAVRSNPGLLAPAIEESLRYECPIQTVTRRVAQDVRLGDAELRSEDLAILMMGAANRDPRQFADPLCYVARMALESRDSACLVIALGRIQVGVERRLYVDHDRPVVRHRNDHVRPN